MSCICDERTDTVVEHYNEDGSNTVIGRVECVCNIFLLDCSLDNSALLLDLGHHIRHALIQCGLLLNFLIMREDIIALDDDALVCNNLDVGMIR